MKEKKRIPSSGDPLVWTSPFASLKQAVEREPTQRPQASNSAHAAPAPRKSRGRVDIIRQTAHRGGKIVTVVTGFLGISLAEKKWLAKEMQQACGAGGTVKEGRIEIQGDQRDAVSLILVKAGFRPVFAGG